MLQVPTALEASGAIQPDDVILSINGIPLPGAGCYRRDTALLEAPGMFPARLRIHRPKPGAIAPEDVNGGDYLEGSKGGGLESSLSRLKQASIFSRLIALFFLKSNFRSFLNSIVCGTACVALG